MKKEKVRELIRKRTVKIGGIVLAAAIVFSGGYLTWQNSQEAVPELVTFVDTEGSIEIEGEEVPLAAPQVTTSTKTTQKTKQIKMKKASKKTYVQKGKTKTKKSTKTSKSAKETTTTVTLVKTDVTNQFKKGSNVKTQVTTEQTTVTKTVVSQQSDSTVQTSAAASASAAATGDLSVSAAAPQVDARVSKAFSTLGFKITVNPSVSYSGLFDARSRSITLKKSGDTVYHELGHFVAFIAGNYDLSSEFQGIFSREKSLYTAFNKAYVLSSASEYFAESFKNYTMDPSALRSSRPETFSAIEKALSRVTDSQVSKIMSAYRSIWGA